MKSSLLLVLTLTVLLVSCTNSTTYNQSNSEGILTYKIKYPTEFKKSGALNVLPETFIVKFSNNRVRHDFKGSFNVFSLNFISQSPKDSCLVSFKFMDKNLTYSIPAEEYFFLYDNDKKPKITFVDDKKKIAGIICDKAIVNFPDQEPFAVYYSNFFDIKKPNRHTPLSEIPGILMAFPLEFDGMKLTLTLDDYNNIALSDSDFKPACHPIKSSEKEIKVMVSTLLDNFK